MTTPKLVIVEYEECPEFEDRGDTGYCVKCGAVEAVHQPWLDKIFDWMESFR